LDRAVSGWLGKGHGKPRPIRKSFQKLGVRGFPQDEARFSIGLDPAGKPAANDRAPVVIAARKNDARPALAKFGQSRRQDTSRQRRPAPLPVSLLLQRAQ
jgi:hypothetical protein